ncbi:MAG: ParB/RepB/Spo0J family partition protein [Candidatus Paceibacterota bacterium]
MADAAQAVVDQSLGRPLPVRLSRIERFEGQPRVFFNQASLEDLADSIQADGQQVPVKISTKFGHPGHFVLIDGERRYRAFEIIQKRTGNEPLIDSFVEVVRDLKDHFRKSTIANLHREDLSPLDEAAALARLREDGETLAGLAKLRGRSTSYIDGYLRIHTLPDEVKALMDPNRPKETRLAITQAIDIARGIPEKEAVLRITVAQEAIERSLGALDTRSLVEYRSGSGGHRAGGRFRKPSDDYKVLTAFLGRTLATATRLNFDLNIDNLYVHRDSEREDRIRDEKLIEGIIEKLQLIRREVVEVVSK